MKNPEFDELIDKAMAGRLAPEEETRWRRLLAKHPELEEEMALGRALTAMPPPPHVSSNFTSRVLQEINREKRASRFFWEDWFRFPRLARLAGTAVVICGVGIGAIHHQRQ